MPHQAGVTNGAKHGARRAVFSKGVGIDHFRAEGDPYVLIRIVLAGDGRILACVLPMVSKTLLSMRHFSNRLRCGQVNGGLNRIGEQSEI